MDIQLEKKKGIQKKHLPYIVGGIAFLLLVGWMIFGNHASTLRVDARGISIGHVTHEQFNDFVRVDGQVQPITVVQLSPEEGGIVQEKVVEEGAQVRRGDIIIRLSNSNLDLQILNAEAELAEKQNLLRNTQVTMEQDRLRNKTEKLQLDLDITRRQRTSAGKTLRREADRPRGFPASERRLRTGAAKTCTHHRAAASGLDLSIHSDGSDGR